jgi:hypothetical protein
LNADQRLIVAGLGPAGQLREADGREKSKEKADQAWTHFGYRNHSALSCVTYRAGELFLIIQQ